MFTICDLQLEPGRFHYITDLKFLSHASVTTLYSINLGYELQLDIENIKHTDADVLAVAKRNLLLNFIGPDVYRLTVDHFSPTKVTDVTCDNVVNFLNKFYTPTCNYLSERM